MEDQDPHARLEGLHRELSAHPDLDERGQETLAGVRSDLGRLAPSSTEGTSITPEERGEMQSRWQSAVVDFENSHPQLARGLEQMANILSNFGL